uniref:Uncharacterized protein n=1 Tax=Syphacia muris TaxID=451379 RepID=A0A0N5AMC8_9BILA
MLSRDKDTISVSYDSVKSDDTYGKSKKMEEALRAGESGVPRKRYNPLTPSTSINEISCISASLCESRLLPSIFKELLRSSNRLLSGNDGFAHIELHAYVYPICKAADVQLILSDFNWGIVVLWMQSIIRVIMTYSNCGGLACFGRWIDNFPEIVGDENCQDAYEENAKCNETNVVESFSAWSVDTRNTKGVFPNCNIVIIF